jgi:hypothetical protein
MDDPADGHGNDQQVVVEEQIAGASRGEEIVVEEQLAGASRGEEIVVIINLLLFIC